MDVSRHQSCNWMIQITTSHEANLWLSHTRPIPSSASTYLSKPHTANRHSSFHQVNYRIKGLEGEPRTSSVPSPWLSGMARVKSSQTDGNLAVFKRPPEEEIPQTCQSPTLPFNSPCQRILYLQIESHTLHCKSANLSFFCTSSFTIPEDH